MTAPHASPMQAGKGSQAADSRLTLEAPRSPAGRRPGMLCAGPALHFER